MTILTTPGFDPPAVMRAALLIGNGGPEMLEVRSDVPVPTVGPGQALIEVAACGVNNTDINTRVGWYSRSVTAGTAGGGFAEARTDDATWGQGGLTFPRIQGADAVGRVVAVDAAGRDLLGRRVMVDPWIRDPHHPDDRSLAGYLGSELDGGFAEYTVVPVVNVHPVESDLSDVELATFACSSSTAEHMLQRSGVAAGHRVVVTGASGGVGSALVQLAKHRGATVVAVAGASKHESVLTLGADAVVDRSAADVPAAARAAIDGAFDADGSFDIDGPFDVVADVVGGLAFAGWLDALARGGRYVTAGAIAGPIVELDLRTLYLHDLELIGATVFPPRVFADLVAVIEQGGLRPVVGGTFGLEEIHAAQEAFGRKEHTGNLVIVL